MRTQFTLAIALAAFSGSVTLAAEMPGMKMDKPASAAAQSVQTNHAVGIVKAVDPAKGTITLSHEPVPAIQWPAMTMGFKATHAQISSVKVGDKVQFEFIAKGMDATVVKISPTK